MPSPKNPAELPEIPEDLGVHPVLLGLLHLAHFLDIADEDAVSPDAATPQLERVGLYVQRLDDEELDELEAQLMALVEHAESAGWSGDQKEWLLSFLEHCGIELEEAPSSATSAEKPDRPN